MKSTNKIISLLLSLIMVFSVFGIVPFSVSAAEENIVATSVTEGDYEYYINYQGKLEISRYNGTSSEVIIPSTLGGHKVTSISGEKGVFANHKEITKVVIPVM